MKFKRTLAVLMLALIVALCGAFTACSDSGVDSGNNNPPQSGNEQTTPENPDEGEDGGNEQGSGENEGNQDNEGDQDESGSQDGEEEEPIEAGDILIVYFSCTGNTEEVAQIMQTAMTADTFEIIPETPYTSADLNYNDSNSRTSVENRDETSRPAIANTVENMAEYETVFIGYPIWHGIAPRIIQTFLEEYDFSDKTIYTFSTSASSSGGTAFSRLQSAYSQINFVDYLHITSSQLSSAQTRVQSWLTEIGIL